MKHPSSPSLPVRRHRHPSWGLRFLLPLLLTTFVTLSGILAFNAAVDPFGIRPAHGLGRLSLHRRPEIERNEYLHKAYAVRHVRPSLVILGSSVTCVGIPAGPEAYNLGLPSAGPIESLAYLQHTLALGCVKKVYLGVDMIGFGLARPSPKAFDPTILLGQRNAHPPFSWASTAILGFGAVKASWRTLRSQEGPGVSYPRGVRDPEAMHQRMAGQSWRTTQKILSRRNQDENVRLGQVVPGSPGAQALTDIARLCRENGVILTIFLQPWNGIALEDLTQEAAWNQFVAWKQLVLDCLISGSGDPQAGYWDFATFQPLAYAMAPDPTAPGEWESWWEMAHYKASVGQHLLDVIQGRASNPYANWITTQSFHSAMDQCRQSMDHFLPQRQLLQRILPPPHKKISDDDR